MPIPAKCSAQLRRLLQSHSITRPAVRDLNGGLGSSNETSATSSTEPRRPIYPNLPYSPYSSPVSSPRVRRKPLRETTRVNSTVQSDGEYVQLNQYKLEQAIGQVCNHCYIVDTCLVQVNLCQKLLLLHQLAHNMMTDCTLNYKFDT